MEPASNLGELSVGEPDPAIVCLEQRVQRLEEAVAALQEKQSSALPQVKAGAPPPQSYPPDAIKEPIAPDPLPLPPRTPWLIVDILAEARAMVRMFFDIHYRMAWYTRAAVLVIFILILTSGLWLGWIPWPIGVLLVKLWDLVLAFLAYKILSREARRYRETVRS